MTEIVTSLGPLPQSDDPEFHPFTEDFERRFFEGAEQVKVEVVLMRETWDEIANMLEENGWKPNEGLIILLTTGMAFLRSERALSVPEGAAGLSEAEIKKLLDRLTIMEARYASIKNFAFDVLRDHRALELKFGPIAAEYANYKEMVWPLKKENDALKAELARLRQEVERLSQAGEAEPVAPERLGLWQRLRDAVMGRSGDAR